MAKPLNEKQEKFVELYLDSNGNLAQIVKAAGYNMTEKAAAVQATRLLKNAKIQQAIREARERRQKAYTVTAAWVLERIAKLAQDDDVTPRDQLKALELLGKHLGMWEKQQGQEDNGVRVVLPDEAASWAE